MRKILTTSTKTSDLENDSMFGASWTGTQAEWDALDKSQFPSNTDITIKITDDGEPSPTPTPTPSVSGYKIDGLSFSGCSCRSGGYCKVGNIVIVNIELYATSTTDMIVSGLPSFQNISRARDVRCTIYNESVDEFDETNTNSEIKELILLMK